MSNLSLEFCLALSLFFATIVSAGIIQPQDLGNGVHQFRAPNTAGSKSYENIVGFTVGAKGEKKTPEKRTKTFGGKFSQCPLGFKTKKNAGTCVPDGSTRNKCTDGQVKNKDGLCVMKVKVPKKLVKDIKKLKAKSKGAHMGPCSVGHKRVNGVCVLSSPLHKLKKAKVTLLANAKKEVDLKKKAKTRSGKAKRRHAIKKSLAQQKALAAKLKKKGTKTVKKAKGPKILLMKTAGEPQTEEEHIAKLQKEAHQKADAHARNMMHLVKTAGTASLKHKKGKPAKRKAKVSKTVAKKVKTPKKKIKMKERVVVKVRPSKKKKKTPGKPSKKKKKVPEVTNSAKTNTENLAKLLKKAGKTQKAKKKKTEERLAKLLRLAGRKQAAQKKKKKGKKSSGSVTVTVKDGDEDDDDEDDEEDDDDDGDEVDEDDAKT